MLFGFILPIRNLEQSNSLGLLAVILLIATVKASDGGAYFAGKSLGKRKLAPALSPGKTIEGSLAAPIGGCLAAAIVIFVLHLSSLV
jgi:phosphatidate cytidylyltransferase